MVDVIDNKKDSSPSLTGPRHKRTAFDYVLVGFFVILILLCFLPLVNIAARSFSNNLALAQGQVGLWPVGFNLDAYSLIFRDSRYMWALGYTVVLTIVATLTSLTLTVLCSYPLIHDNLKGKQIFSIAMILTMYFSAGIIPNFILMRDLGLLNNPLVLIIPNAISVFNVIIMRAFFYNVPYSLRESAEIEGANPFQILTRIYLPLSTPVLATLALFYAVGRWNGFTDALIYITVEQRWQPIQLILWNILQGMMNPEAAAMEGIGMLPGPGTTEQFRAGTIMFATVPILLVYPWLQRYFIAGVSLGAVKE